MTNPLLEIERALGEASQRFAIAHLCLNPKREDERLEELRQQYETILTVLESEFLRALLSGD